MQRFPCSTLAAALALSCREAEPPTAPPSEPTLSVTAEVLEASQVSVGGSHTCALTSAGVAYCWGSNGFGQLGDGTSGNGRLRPVRVAGGLTFRQVNAGGAHTCGITTADRLYCWGANLSGQLGDGTSGSIRTSPVAVASVLSFRSVSAGRTHTCGVTTDNVAYCWGLNNVGQLGDGTRGNFRMRPVQVAGGLALKVVSARGDHSCGVTTGNAAYCWGYNFAGQLGDGTTVSRTRPTRVVGGLLFTQLSTGIFHTCALTSAGVAYCWGDNGGGRLGTGTRTGPEDCGFPCSTRPARVVGGLVLRSVSAGGSHTCGVTTGDASFCWGVNFDGRLGDGTRIGRTRPTRVVGGLAFRQVRAGLGHSCGMTTSNVAYCWGKNDLGQLGNGTTTDRTRPVAVAPPAP